MMKDYNFFWKSLCCASNVHKKSKFTRSSPFCNLKKSYSWKEFYDIINLFLLLLFSSFLLRYKCKTMPEEAKWTLTVCKFFPFISPYLQKEEKNNGCEELFIMFKRELNIMPLPIEKRRKHLRVEERISLERSKIFRLNLSFYFFNIKWKDTQHQTTLDKILKGKWGFPQ